ncbi:hypothetical protein PG994_004091 [Apiospora phragmitis]|uniref:Uncharacterized protein n=1 Tax=Apiospora phragmitis TaxID=2905665 RepID=A0ABR1VQR4_9PEZI
MEGYGVNGDISKDPASSAFPMREFCETVMAVLLARTAFSLITLSLMRSCYFCSWPWPPPRTRPSIPTQAQLPVAINRNCTLAKGLSILAIWQGCAHS